MTDPAAWPEDTQQVFSTLIRGLGVEYDTAAAIARAALTLNTPEGVGRPAAQTIMESMPTADMESIEKLVSSMAFALDEYLSSYSAPPDIDAAARYEAFRAAFRTKAAQLTMVVLMHVLTTLRISDEGEATLSRELFREKFAEASAPPAETDEDARAVRAAYLVHRLNTLMWRTLDDADKAYATRIAAKIDDAKVEPYELRDLEDMALRAQPNFDKFGTPWGQEEKRKEYADAVVDMLRKADTSRLDADEAAWVAEHAAMDALTEDEVRIAWRLLARMDRREERTVHRDELPGLMTQGWGWYSGGGPDDEFAVVRWQGKKVA